jgi:sugar phosphate isomerase/epimerase
MKVSQIAAQFFTLRDHVKTSAGFAAACRKVREIGYQAVQISAVGPLPEEEILAVCQGEGLTICATHEGSATILDEPQKVVERLGKLKCRFTAYPHPSGLNLAEPAQVRQLAARLDAAGAVLHQAGQVLCYHNHAIEFVRCDGKTALEVIYDSTKPENLQGEPDTYWVQYGGGDSVAWCRRLKGRLPLLHLKDYGFSGENKPVMAEIGNGNLDWPAIIAAAEESGCQWFIVEQDVCPGDPFDSLRISFDYLQGLCRG